MQSVQIIRGGLHKIVHKLSSCAMFPALRNIFEGISISTVDAVPHKSVRRISGCAMFSGTENVLGGISISAAISYKDEDLTPFRVRNENYAVNTDRLKKVTYKD